ncbi:DUF2125 domain-containing protein [Oceaniglobus indicus]|uniref:DUF2125 domain-containing protein n=1 Tax=Oceaniglobus indicus TaxID=2047749 RepID=UPI000C186702|nr:DUF2125 domain-containing protein [Oceaniglobus indicus]
MRKLLAVILIAALAWGGYWFVGSSAVEKGMKRWFAAQRERGWTATYSDLSTTGFPNRFDTTITDLDLYDPVTGFGWRAPFFQIFALSYRPNQIITAFANDQTVQTPAESIALASTRMRASATFALDTGLALDHSTLIADGVTLTGETGWRVSADQIRAATRPAVGLQHGHDLDIVAVELAPGPALRAAIDAGGSLPPTLGTVKLDASLGFDAPWDRFALGNARPRLTTVDLTEARIVWGPLDLRASGDVAVGADGLPDGRITVTATGWRRMIDMAVGAGLIPAAATDTVTRVLTMLAQSTDDGETLDLPLSFSDGRMALGPVDLGPAPRLR